MPALFATPVGSASTTIVRGTASTLADAACPACRVPPATSPISTIHRDGWPAFSATKTWTNEPTLILKRANASRPSGQWSEDDYDVLGEGEAVGRLMKVIAGFSGSCS
jgi:hypothetical protein